MTNEAITDSAGLNGPVTEKPAPKPRKPRAKKTTAPVKNVQVQAIGEADNSGVISSPKKAHTDGPVQSNTGSTASGVIGSKAADRVFEKPAVVEKPQQPDPNKVALWSDKNIRWTGVGALSKGYNIVTKEAADKWLEKQGIRNATPEEVATYYSK